MSQRGPCLCWYEDGTEKSGIQANNTTQATLLDLRVGLEQVLCQPVHGVLRPRLAHLQQALGERGHHILHEIGAQRQGGQLQCLLLLPLDLRKLGLPLSLLLGIIGRQRCSSDSLFNCFGLFLLQLPTILFRQAEK